VSLGLDQALRDVDAKEQTTFTQLESSEARLQDLLLLEMKI